MEAKPIDPQSICNVTIVGEPADTAAVIHRLAHPAATVEWAADGVDHTIHLAELSIHAPIARLERSIRVADGVIAIVDAVATAPRLETVLQVADDHQVARLCLVTGLDRPGADFDRCLRTLADIRGAVPLALQIPLGLGIDCAGVLDLPTMWELESMAEFYGGHWQVAEQWYRTLTDTVTEQDAAHPFGTPRFPPAQLHNRIRHLTRIGEVVPVLCRAPATSDNIASLLDAVVRYLPSPMDVCQPEHALDY
ncbi:GTP-binding protein [Nocardia stercoris]|uniref:Tr-type G domain-containing protein n=1 Tax=Nocardia stercoris TaxID=2483361 RepID=A0A3M2KW04_9NOCA|nr:GTP-binding protein [Nocardia stercoris]RMI28393.1 hypothetical protein EBN03_30545 [Nocardia stercoris]